MTDTRPVARRPACFLFPPRASFVMLGLFTHFEFPSRNQKARMLAPGSGGSRIGLAMRIRLALVLMETRASPGSIHRLLASAISV
jgi:hypothetical protein